MKTFAVGITVVLLSLVLFQYGGGETVTAISSLNLTVVAAVTGLLLATFAFSGMRTLVVMKDAGLPIHWTGAAHVSLIGAVGNILLNVVGYTTARSVYLRSVGIEISDAILLSFYEKIVALVVLFLISVFGAVYLFGSINLDWSGQAFFLMKIALTALTSLLLGLVFAYGREAKALFSRFMAAAGPYCLFRVVLLTILIHASMLGCYVAIGWVVAPQANLISIAAASAVVMFAASLPISFSGWGVRELSAVHAFGILGVSAAQALAIAVTIGALSMVVMLVLTGLTSVAAPAYHEKREAKKTDGGTAGKRSLRGDTLLAVLVTLMAATLVFFNVHLPTQTGKINVNLADPVVLIGAVFALILWYRNRTVIARWRIAGVETMMAAMTGVIIYGLLLGWISFGWFDWAFVNRGIGWGVVLAYFLTGALVAFAGGDKWLRLFAKCFVAAAAAVVLVDYGLRFALSLGVAFERSSFPSRMEGLAQNPNAYAFQMLIVYAVSITMGVYDEGSAMRRLRYALEGIILAGIWLSSSRAGFITGAVLLLVLFSTGTLKWKRLLVPAIISVALILLLSYLVSVLGWLDSLGFLPFEISGIISLSSMAHQVTQANDSERLHSMLGGLALWRDNWFFGAGLGAFMRGEIQASGNALMIHNTPIWLLAEMGLVGIVAAVLPVILVARNMIARLRFRMEPPVLAAFCCLAIIVIEMQPHEMLYQRTFWLIFGAMLAMPHGVLFGGEAAEARDNGTV